MVLRRGANVALVLAATVVIAAGIKLAAPLMNPFVLAMFLAVMTAPLVIWLQEKGVPRFFAVFSGVMVDLALIAGLALFVGGSITAFGDRLPVYEERLTALVGNAHSTLLRFGIDISTSSLRDVADPAQLMEMVRALVQSLASLISKLVLVLMLVAFMLFDASGTRAKLSRVLTDEEDLRDVAEGVAEVKRYLVVKTGTSAATGAVLGAWCFAMNVDLPLLWGLLAFLLNYIPNIGAVIATFPPVLLALIQFGPAGAVAVLGGYLVVNVGIGIIEPRLMGRALGLSPLVVFISMIVWGWLLGPVGALFSAPLTMILKHWFEHTHDFQWVAVVLGPVEPPARTSRTSLESPLEAEVAES